MLVREKTNKQPRELILFLQGIIEDPNEEMLYWAEVMNQQKFIIAQPKINLQ